MSQRIGGSPRGLLELFRLKATGDMPALFGDTVTPTVDVSEFYGSHVLATGQGTQVVGAFPLEATQVATNANRLLGLGFEMVSGAAFGAVQFFWGVRFPTPGAAIPRFALGSSLLTFTAAAQTAWGGSMLPVPIVLPPGGQMWARANSAVAGADHALRVMFLIQALA
jgi:hypothetical protein